MLKIARYALFAFGLVLLPISASAEDCRATEDAGAWRDVPADPPGREKFRQKHVARPNTSSAVLRSLAVFQISSSLFY